MSDMLIIGGSVLDGDGGPARPSDIRIAGGVITEIAAELTPHPGKNLFDATGYLVTPGFVDVHTHYDGQATWDEQLAPSCWHGVTVVTKVIAASDLHRFAPTMPPLTRSALILFATTLESRPRRVSPGA